MYRKSEVLWRVVAMAGTVALVACADATPTTPSSVSLEGMSAAARFDNGFSLRGRVTSTVRRLGVGGPLGSVLSTQSGVYRASIDDRGEAEGSVEMGGVTTEMTILSADKPGRRTGRWKRTVPSRDGKGDVTLEFASNGESPASELEARRGGRVINRTAKVWKRLRGAWRVTQIVTTGYVDNRPVISETLDFDEGSTEVGIIAKATSEVTRFQGPAANSDGVCEREMNAVYDSFDVYEASAVSLSGCLLNPFACAGAITGYVMATRRLQRAFAAADACLAEF